LKVGTQNAQGGLLENMKKGKTMNTAYPHHIIEFSRLATGMNYDFFLKEEKKFQVPFNYIS
jgi:hypothetical protein